MTTRKGKEMTEAQRERDRIMDLFEETREEYLVRARVAAANLWRDRKTPLTIDDVREVCPPPGHFDPRVMGAVFNKNDWTPVGFINSKRGHGRAIRTFVPIGYAR